MDDLDNSKEFDDSQENQPNEPQETESDAANVANKTENQAEGEESEADKREEVSTINSDLIRGHINTIILRALYERDKYGYEIMNDIEQKSHGQYTLKQPTLYSALKRLETQGYIKAYWKTDEVTSGGRRKYFTLTESGKEITEKNLAEWEYSRTIIDSLISDRSFDFSRPAPTPVDFTILRNSVSRVPVVRSDEADRAAQTGSEKVDDKPQGEGAQASEKTEEKPQESIQPSEQQAQPKVDERVQQVQTTEVIQQTQPTEVIQQVQTTEGKQQAQPVAETKPETAEDEARRVAHENYMRLISEPIKPAQQPVDDVVPGSRNIDSDSLLYNNKPETERDYKNLIDGIFNRAVTNGTVQTVYASTPTQQVTERRQEPRRTVRLIDRGRADGVAIASTEAFDANTTYATSTTYNKGLTFLKSSAAVLAVTLIEFIFCFIFLKQLNTTWVYPTVILLLGLVQFSVFGILALRGYGKNCVKPTTHSYLSTCIILTIIAILIISASSFLMNMNPNSASDVVKMIIIPSITALNVTVFAGTFRLLVK